MTKERLQIFVECAVGCFARLTKTAAVVQTPYLQGGEAELLDFSAVIGISGNARGCVYYTAQKGLLSRLLQLQGEPSKNPEVLCDTVGEIANIISGNARKQFGGEFLISVPVILEGRPKRLALPRETQTFVIPITWMDFNSILLVCLESTPEVNGAPQS